MEQPVDTNSLPPPQQQTQQQQLLQQIHTQQQQPPPQMPIYNYGFFPVLPYPFMRPPGGPPVMMPMGPPIPQQQQQMPGIPQPVIPTFRMPEIFPFNIDFGDLKRAELNRILQKQSCISWYSAWNELRTGKRSHLFRIETLSESDNIDQGVVDASKTNNDYDDNDDDKNDLSEVSTGYKVKLKRTEPRTAVLAVGYDLTAVEVVEVTPVTSPKTPSATSPASQSHGSSWASLFRSGNAPSSDKGHNIELHATQNSLPQSSVSVAESANGMPAQSTNGHALNETHISANGHSVSSFANFTVGYEKKLLVPRGIVNRGNMCFMNSILQLLIHCPPFYNFLHFASIHIKLSLKASNTPLIDSLIMFLKEFRHDDGEGTEIDAIPVLPEYVYETIMLNERFKRGRQEDAEEFLGFLLDGIHEELIKYVEPAPETVLSADKADDAGEWVEIGHKNKTVITRNLEFRESAITRIFGGKIRSVIKCPGQKDSVTIEPYHALQLDISRDDTKSVKDALLHLSKPEVISGYGSTGAEASKQILLESLPPILILHLKRFVFANNETQKLHKHIDYSLELNIPREILSTQLLSTQSVIDLDRHCHYKLFGVVYHHGKGAADGHYTCDTCRANDEWLNIDDTVLANIPESQVVDESRDKCAYILFYIRS